MLVLAWGKPACGQGAARDSTTVVFELTKPIGDPKNFNWFLKGVPRDQGAHQAMWEPLFLFNYNTGELEPWLAAEPMKPKEPPANPTEKFKEWILKLRPNVEWSDSTVAHPQRFTAADVKFTADLVLGKTGKNFEPKGPNASEALAFISQVEDVTAIDDVTVDFKLKNSNPRFPLETFGATNFSSFLIMPKHIWEGKDPATFKFYPPIGTGPYVLETVDNTHATWKRNDDWWGAKPFHGNILRPLPEPMRLTWLVENGPGFSMTDLIANKIDAAAIPYSLADFIDAAGKNPKIVGWSSLPMAWNYPCARQIEINTKSPTNPALANAKIRRAFSLLIDRAKLAHDAYGDTTRPSATMFADYGAMKPFIDAISPGNRLSPNADLAAADTLLVGEGYAKDPVDHFYKKAGTNLGAKLLVDPSNSSDMEAAKTIASQLSAVGVKIDVNPDTPPGVKIEHKTLFGHNIPTGDYEMVYSYLSCGSVGEPFTSMNRYTATYIAPIGYGSPALNNTGRWDTQGEKTYSDIVTDLGKKAVGDASIPAQVAQAYKYLNNEMPFIPIVQSPTIVNLNGTYWAGIVPFNTTYWAGWPSVGGDNVPMTSWASTMRTIHELTTSKCVRFFRPIPAEMNGMKFEVDGGVKMVPDFLGQIGLTSHPITISFGQNDRPLAFSLQAKATGKKATVIGVSDTGATQFSNNPPVSEAGMVFSTTAARQLKLSGDPEVVLSKVCFAD